MSPQLAATISRHQIIEIENELREEFRQASEAFKTDHSEEARLRFVNALNEFNNFVLREQIPERFR